MACDFEDPPAVGADAEDDDDSEAYRMRHGPEFLVPYAMPGSKQVS